VSAGADVPPLVALRGVGKSFRRGASEVAALRDVTLDIATGEMLSIVGPSGSGKSTLLNVLGGLERPTSGTYRLDGRLVSELSDADLSRLRNRAIGFVFQAFHLIPQLSVIENVETPLLYSGLPASGWRSRAWRCLERVGLTQRAEHRPSELSGGEAQRAALARALVLDPRMLLADEPTGNLDSATGGEIARLLCELNADGRTVVLVTHNESLARTAQRIISLRDGAVDSARP
jgi:putative ABC transport system ATP-binding protein